MLWLIPIHLWLGKAAFLNVMINPVSTSPNTLKPSASVELPVDKPRQDKSDFIKHLSDVIGNSANDDVGGAADRQKVNPETSGQLAKPVSTKSGDDAGPQPVGAEGNDEGQTAATPPNPQLLRASAAHKLAQSDITHADGNKKLRPNASGELSSNDETVTIDAVQPITIEAVPIDQNAAQQSVTELGLLTQHADASEKKLKKQDDAAATKSDGVNALLPSSNGATVIVLPPVIPTQPFNTTSPTIAQGELTGNKPGIDTKTTTARMDAKDQEATLDSKLYELTLDNGDPISSDIALSKKFIEQAFKSSGNIKATGERRDDKTSRQQEMFGNLTLELPDNGIDGSNANLPAQNFDGAIGQVLHQNTIQGHLSTLKATDPAQPIARGPIPYAMLPIEIGLSALNGKRSIDVLLKPEELGAVEIRLEVSNNSDVKAHIRADRPETLSMLMNDAHMLKNALDQTGMTTNSDSLQFSLRQDGQSQSNTQNPSHQQSKGQQRAYEKSNTSSSMALTEEITMKPLVRVAGLLDVQI